MISIVVVFLAAGSPFTALRSTEVFAAMPDCVVALDAAHPRMQQAAEMLSARLNAPVTFEAGCVVLASGTAA